ncbi:porin [Vibrio splendidus]|uniref:porin n=1 Tax=Vibrio splendidus TaxID=29497 RepID=UPI000C8370CA|nr:porin [Vibrio splendidus]PMG62585.1 porin [Vibrio splendidus]
MNKSILSAVILTALTSGSAFAAHTFTNDVGDSLTLDGRFDVRYQDKGGDHNGEWNSGSSRFGLKGQMGLDNDWTGFGHAEWGYNSGANGDNIYDRLLYAGVEHEKYGKIAAGTKQWSTFYDVAWFTDMGRVFGSRGSGYYNLSDWGISSGTGRAENSITYRNSINDNWKYGFTYQTTREDVAVSTRFNQANSDTVTLKNGIGASTLYTVMDGLTIGLAYHQNEFDDVDSTVQNIKDGDTQRIGLLGVNYTNDGLFVGFTYSQGSNWETTSQSEFYDHRGAEFFTYYHFENGLRPTFNVNYLTDTDDNANGYERQLIIPGLEYHFKKNKFLVWTEYQFDNGKDSYNGVKYENNDDQFAAGIRYYF